MKSKKNINKKMMIFVLISILILITIIIVFFNKKNTIEAPYNITNMKDLLEYYNCKLIRKSKSNNENIDFDIYVEFDRSYYTEEESNKAYFVSIIKYLSENLEYMNYNLIDVSRDIIITVLCNNEENIIQNIYYNGDMSYFINKENQLNVSKYKPKEKIELDVDSKELNELIKNGWINKKTNFGTVDSEFNQYKIYFDEGIEVKTIVSKVYNIIFNEKYDKEIVNGLKVNDDFDTIKQILGIPAFENTSVIGYICKDFYIFFSKNEVSIYRQETEYKDEEFIKLINQFLENKNITTLINKITDIWNDYDLYETNEDSILLRYNIKGVSIYFTKTSGKVTFYDNYEGKVSENEYISNLNSNNIPSYVELALDTNLIWEAERLRKNIQLDYYQEEYIKTLHTDKYTQEEIDEELLEKIEKIQYKTNNFYVFDSKIDGEYSCLKFISIDRNYPNSEINIPTKITEYNWIDDNNFVFSIPNEGIYLYDAIKRKKTTLIQGKEKFKITNVEKNIIYYDQNKKIDAKV